MAILLQSLYQADLVLCRDSGIYGDGFYLLLKLTLPHLLQVRPLQDLAIADLQLGSYGPGGKAVVPGDHHRADTCLLAQRYGLHYLLSGRVHHPGQAGKDMVRFDLA